MSRRCNIITLTLPDSEGRYDVLQVWRGWDVASTVSQRERLPSYVMQRALYNNEQLRRRTKDIIRDMPR